MKQKTHLRFLAALLLGLLLTGLTGCGMDGGVVGDRVLPMEDALHLPKDTLTALPQLWQDVDQQADGDAASLHVWETAGDGNLLYIVYSVTVPEDWEQILGSRTFRVNFDLDCGYADPALEQESVTQVFNLPQRYDPRLHTLYYMAAYSFSEGYTGKELRFQVEGLTYIEENVPTSLSDVLTLTWMATNETPQMTAQDGRCTLTPLRLTATVPAQDVPFEDDESFEDTVLRPSLCLRYQDGTTLQDTAPQKGEEEAEEETDGEEEAREPSVYGTLSAGWGDAIVEVSALPADGTLFSLEGLSSVEVLGQSFAFS